MPEYRYSALDGAGIVQEGRMSAPNENALADQLRAAGSFLIRTEVSDGPVTAPPPATHTHGHIDRKDLLAFRE